MFKGESLEEFKMIIQSFDPLRDGASYLQYHADMITQISQNI